MPNSQTKSENAFTRFVLTVTTQHPREMQWRSSLAREGWLQSFTKLDALLAG
jgi:hypothetical protein